MSRLIDAEAAKDAIRVLPALVVTNTEYVPQLKRRPDQGIDRAAALLVIEALARRSQEDAEHAEANAGELTARIAELTVVVEQARLVAQWHDAIGSGPIEVLNAELGELGVAARAALDTD